MKLAIHFKSGKTITIGRLTKEEAAIEHGNPLVNGRDRDIASIPDWAPGRKSMYSVYRICCRDVEAVQMIAENDEERKWLFDALK